MTDWRCTDSPAIYCAQYLPLLQASCRAEGKCMCGVCACAPFCSSSSIQLTLPEAQQLYRGVTPSIVEAFTYTHKHVGEDWAIN